MDLDLTQALAAAQDVAHAEAGVGVEGEAAAHRPRAHDAAVADLVVIAENEATSGEAGVARDGGLKFQFFGIPGVVGIDQGDPLAAGGGDAVVARATDAAVGDPEIAQIGAGGQAGRGVVGGAVIDDDQFEVAEGLGLDAGDGTLDELAGVVGDQDDGDKRRSGHARTVPFAMWNVECGMRNAECRIKTKI